MRKNFISIVFPLILIFNLFTTKTSGQGKHALSPSEIEQYRKQAEQMVSFLEYNFNTLGDPEVSVKDKDIIINQSYSKLFADEKVQIEDDLDENRDIPINKDVQAYLKDIDFFFKKVTFTFHIDNIEQLVNEKNQLFFKVTLNRTLNGITIDDDTVNTNRIRYVEINLNDDQKDLKIASIYTTKLNEKEELRKWWNDLPSAWKSIFGDDITLGDTLRLSDILYFDDSLVMLDYYTQRKMSRDTLSVTSFDTLTISMDESTLISAGLLDRQLRKLLLLDTINISGNRNITDLEPLSKLTLLKRINCNSTRAGDLMPLRNLTHLEMLDCSGMVIESVEPLRYSTKLEYLNISGTLVQHIETLSNFNRLNTLVMNNTLVDSLEAISMLVNLKELEIAQTNIKNLRAISNFKNLERLDFSRTTISDISPLKELITLHTLKFEKTPVSDLKPLKDLLKLQILFIDYTKVNDLTPLQNLPELRRIYCDQTGVNRQSATTFVGKNPDILVIYESSELIHWWNSLTVPWKEVFAGFLSEDITPTKEELHTISRIKSIDLSDNRQITDLKPLQILPMLSEVICQGTEITTLEHLKNALDLQKLNFSNTQVRSLTPLSGLKHIEELYFDNTPVSSISPIMDFEDLRYLYCDNSPVNRSEIVSFMQKNPDCLVIYQTDELKEWWSQIPEVWKLLAEKFVDTNGELTREQLQQVVNLRKVDLSDVADMAAYSMKINELTSIGKLILLKELRFSNTMITDLTPLRNMKTIEILACPNNPIESIEPLGELINLRELDIQNTPVSTLEFLATLRNLKVLKCSGTQIKNLKGIELLTSLEQLDCFNTGIKNLDAAENLPNLKLIRCYNTKITSKKIEKFRSNHPDIEVIHY